MGAMALEVAMRSVRSRWVCLDGRGLWAGLWICLCGCGSYHGQEGVRESSAPSDERVSDFSDTVVVESNFADEPDPAKDSVGFIDTAIPKSNRDDTIALPNSDRTPHSTDMNATPFPLYGMARYFTTVIFQDPRRGARRIGDFRKGAVFRLRQVDSAAGCDGGWYAVVGGGYVCASRGVSVSESPMDPQGVLSTADPDAPLPYEYRGVRRDEVISWRRLPTAAQVEAARQVHASRHASDGTGTDRNTLSMDTETDPGQERLDGGFGIWPSIVHMPMDKGFHVSVTDRLRWRSGVRYQQTLRGNYIPTRDLRPIRPSALEGRELGPEQTLPLVFVFQRNVERRSLAPDGERWIAREKVPRYAVFPCLGEKTRAGQRMVQVGENAWIRASAVRRAAPMSPPESVGPEERWISVNLTEQTLVAYEGKRPVFATLVTTGKAGSRTPVGTFRVNYKHVTTTMKDLEDASNRFSLEDVPWTQYYDRGYALHGVYWHDGFGRVRSRGCINLSPVDARRLFLWTEPQLPQGRHGQAADTENPGTLVWVHR
jgi:hypothetical protein